MLQHRVVVVAAGSFVSVSDNKERQLRVNFPFIDTSTHPCYEKLCCIPFTTVQFCRLLDIYLMTLSTLFRQEGEICPSAVKNVRNCRPIFRENPIIIIVKEFFCLLF